MQSFLNGYFVPQKLINKAFSGGEIMNTILRGVTCTVILALFSSQSGAATLQDGGFDFNPSVGTWGDFVPHQWNAEGSVITTAITTVVPFDTDGSGTARMLQLNSGFGTGTQVQQYFIPAAVVGDVFELSALFNDHTAGAIGSLSLFAQDAAGVDGTPLAFASASLTVDGDASSWEQLTVQLSLPVFTTHIGIYLGYNSASLGTGGAAFIDSVSLQAVPVPAAVWLFGSGLGLLGWMRRK